MFLWWLPLVNNSLISRLEEASSIISSSIIMMRLFSGFSNFSGILSKKSISRLNGSLFRGGNALSSELYHITFVIGLSKISILNNSWHVNHVFPDVDGPHISSLEGCSSFGNITAYDRCILFYRPTRCYYRPSVYNIEFFHLIPVLL